MQMIPCRRRLKQTSTVGGLTLHLGNNDPYVIPACSLPSFDLFFYCREHSDLHRCWKGLSETAAEGVAPRDVVVDQRIQ
jgi:hypothetical protein